MKKSIIFIIFVWLTSNVTGQTFYSKKSLEADMDSLVSYIEQVHPNPYTCIPKKDFYNQIETCKKGLGDSTSLIEYYTLVSPIVSSLNDGHTGLGFPLQEWKMMNPYCFPFNPEISNDEKLFAPKYQTYLPENAEILSINGISSKGIINKLINSISGESKSYRISLLKMSFIERFGTLYGFKSEYKVEYIYENQKKSLIINGIKLNELMELLNKKQQEIQKNKVITKKYDYKTMDNGKIGIIEFNSFSDLPKFKEFLDSTFIKIKTEKTKNLIIDLRKNGGGNSDLGDELFQYISRVPFAQFGKITIKYSKIRADFYKSYRQKGYFNSLSDSTFNELISPEFGTSKTINNKLVTFCEKNPLRFEGKVYLLTSPLTFSSASDFAWCFQYFKMGKIIGEETGGHIVCFGELIYKNLPISKLQLYISSNEIYGYGATENDRHGVIPDIKVNVDNALNYTIEKIINK